MLRSRPGGSHRFCRESSLYVPASVSTQDKRDSYAVHTAIRERRLDTLTLTEGIPAAQTASVLLAVRSRYPAVMRPSIVLPKAGTW